MKILLVSNMYPSKKYPHYGIFVRNVENILEEQGHRVKTVILEKCDSKIKKFIKYIIFYFSVIYNGIFGRYDVIYGHYLSHIALPILITLKINKKCKLILNAHGNDVVPENKSDYKFIPLVKKILFKAEILIVPSNYYRTIMVNDYGFPENKIVMYPSGGVDSKIFKKIDKELLHDYFNFPKEYFYVGYVSRIEQNKGWDIFLKAANVLMKNPVYKDRIRFVVVGDGSQQNLYDETVEEMNIKKYIYKFKLLDQGELAKIYNILNVFCFPTYRKSESLGLVGLEAMSCGCVVVASNIGGPASYIKDSDNGFLFEPKSYEELVKCIVKVLKLSNENKKIIAQNAILTSEKYEKEFVKEILLEAFNSL